MTDTNQLHTHDTLVSGTTSSHPASHIPILYYGISIRRLVWFFILTLGLYRYYWFYKNWKAIKEAEKSDISPFWRSFFGIFFCHALFKCISKSTQRYSNKRLFSPTSLATWYIIWLTIGALFGLWFLIIFLLVKAQRAILFNNAQVIPNYKPVSEYTPVEILLGAIGVILWISVVARLMA